jgi:hypothetical protein
MDRRPLPTSKFLLRRSKANSGRIAFAVLIAAALLAGLVVWTYQGQGGSVARSEEWRTGIGVEIYQGAHFKPEPGERKAFILACLALPLACLISLKIATAIEKSKHLRFCPLVAAIGSGIGLYYLWIATAIDRGLVWATLWPFVGPAICLTVVVCMVLLATRRMRSRTLYGVLSEVVALAACVAFACYEISPGWMSVYATAHLEPVLFPVIQVLNGRTILVDTQSVYGLFPHFLEPIFRLVPLSISNFSLVMAGLLLLTLFSIYRFLRLATPGPLTATIAFLGYLFGPFTALNAGYPHYQCYPLRTVFPALVLWLGARYVKRPNRLRLLALSVIAGLSLLWNLDTGIACVGGTLALLVGRGSIQRGSWQERALIVARDLGGFLLVVTGVLLCAGTYLFMRSGELPRVGELVAYQSIFYRDGFLMEPMQPLGGWWLVVVVYVWAMASGVARLFGLGSKRLSPLYLMLAVMGLGIFAYYQGRSVVPNLYYVAWPAYLVCGLFLGDLVIQSRRWFLRVRSPWQWIDNATQLSQLATVAFSLCLLIASAVHCRERVGMVETWSDYQAEYDEYTRDWYDRIRPAEQALHTADDQTPVLVLSARDHLWHLFLRHPSNLTNAGFNHIFRTKEFDQVCRIIDQQEAACVVWDETYLQVLPEIDYSFVSNAEKVRLLEQLRKKYRIRSIAAGPGDLPFSVWVPNSEPTMIAGSQEKGAEQARSR